MPGFERVEFYSEGYKLLGDFHCPHENAPCVLLCHGMISSKDSEKWQAFASNLEGEDYAVLRFNFRGCGRGSEWSEGDFQDTTLSTRIKDYKAALDFLAATGKLDTSRLGVIGSSLGGSTIIAAKDPRPRAYVTLATPVRFEFAPEALRSFREKGYYEIPGTDELRMSRTSKTFYDDLNSYDIAEAVKEIERPLLIIHGNRDATVPISDAYRLYENANEPKRREVIDGGSHSFVDTGHLDKVIGLSFGWLKEYL